MANNIEPAIKPGGSQNKAEGNNLESTAPPTGSLDDIKSKYDYESVKNSPEWGKASKISARELFMAGNFGLSAMYEPLKGEDEEIFKYLWGDYLKALGVDPSIKNYPANHPDMTVKEFSEFLHQINKERK